MAPEAWHVGRTMRLLELLAFAPLSAPQLAVALHAQPRTVRRVLTRLHAEGYVDIRDGRRRLYEPTMRLVALAGQVVENSELARTARPYVQLAQQRSGGAAHLVVPSYQQVLCLVHAAPGRERVSRPQLRELVPAHCTAGGKVLLAFRERWRDSVLAAPMTQYTDRTVTQPEALRRELEEVREQRYADEAEEYQAGVHAVAVPVLVDGHAAAALSVSGLPAGAGHDLLEALEHAARDLTEDLERREERR